jgi:hypothetical protein
MGGTFSMQGTIRGAYSILVGKVKKRVLETKHRWEDNIKKYRKETGHADVAWLHLAQDTIEPEFRKRYGISVVA